MPKHGNTHTHAHANAHTQERAHLRTHIHAHNHTNAATKRTENKWHYYEHRNVTTNKVKQLYLKGIFTQTHSLFYKL